MTPAGRALVGAIIGALLACAWHPKTRPFVLPSLNPQPTISAVAEVYQDPPLQPPTTLIEASRWVRTASERDLRRKLEPRERRTLDRILLQTIAADRTNAYWRQARFALVQGPLSPAGSVTVRTASRAGGWNDYQTADLIERRKRLLEVLGQPFAWHWAVLYHDRSDVPAQVIERASRTLSRSTRVEDREGLLTRAAIIRNGSLMRDGSRSIRVGLRGANMVDVGSYPPDLVGMPTPKRLLLAQNEVYNRLTEQGFLSEASAVNESFRRNDGWRALASRPDYEEALADLSLWAVFAAGVPGAMVVVAAFGLLMWGAGLLARRIPTPGIPWPFALAGSGALALCAFAASQHLLASVVLLMCASTVAYGSEHPRSRPGASPGPFFTLACAILGTTLLITLVLWWVSRSAAAQLVFPLSGAPYQLTRPEVFSALAAIFLGLLLMIAPTWAFVQRRSTAPMVAQVGITTGRGITFWALVLGLVSVPCCLYGDRTLERSLSAIATNEPIYYLIR